VPNKTIMLANLPQQLRDILAGLLSGQPDMMVVEPQAADGLIAALATAEADAVVVASSDSAALDAIDPALARIANLSILALSLDGRSACIHRIRSETQVLTDVTPQGIVDALAGAADRTSQHEPS